MENAGAAGIGPDDVIILTVKGQHTQTALDDLRGAGVVDQPVFCAQNGVANEGAALRVFPNVHGINVMLPCQYNDMGETVAWCSPNFGNFDVGRYPGGLDAADHALAKALTAGGIGGYPTETIMRFKYGKLFVNLGNIVQAALGPGVEAKEVTALLEAEARAVLERAGIDWVDVGFSDPRRELMQRGDVPGETKMGGSTSQSLMRGAGSVETDYLNGEIAMLGRLHGVATPANDYMQRLALRLARDNCPPGSVTRAELAEALGITGVS